MWQEDHGQLKGIGPPQKLATVRAVTKVVQQQPCKNLNACVEAKNGGFENRLFTEDGQNVLQLAFHGNQESLQLQGQSYKPHSRYYFFR